MLNKDGQRMLAYVAEIKDVSPIPKYDRVEYAHVNNWGVIVLKSDNFKPGDKCVYFEIDSKCPNTDERFKFLEKRNYKVKSIKMCGVYSQGLIMPLSAFNEFSSDVEVGTDATSILGIKYASDDDNKRKGLVKPNQLVSLKQSMCARHADFIKSHAWVKKLLKKDWGVKLLAFFWKVKPGEKDFPTQFPFVHKTDEERVENLDYESLSRGPWVKTTKVDGTSCTYILERKPSGKFEFYVCSRNVRMLDEEQECYHGENVYWEMANKYNIKDRLKDFLFYHPEMDYVCLQGECAGPGVQGNPHGLKERMLFGFNFIDSINGRWNSTRAKIIAEPLGIHWVPIVDENYMLPADFEEFKKSADGNCEVPGSVGLREGYVYRSVDGQLSFKNVSREYLISKGE